MQEDMRNKKEENSPRPRIEDDGKRKASANVTVPLLNPKPNANNKYVPNFITRKQKTYSYMSV